MPKIRIEILVKNEEGEIIVKSDSPTFEMAEESLGSLERFFQRYLKQTDEYN